jgi:hypothetical protein
MIKIPSFFSGTSIAMLGNSQKAQKKSKKRILGTVNKMEKISHL